MEYDVVNKIHEVNDKTDNVNFPELSGYLSKWTNYIHGWQKRWIVLKDGTLFYYKSHLETRFGCRGAISLFQASIEAHEYDECRFDVTVNVCTWCLRASNVAEKKLWLNALFVFKGVDSGYNSENSLKRQNSLVSVQSSSFPSSTSSDLLAPSDTHSLIELKQKLTELETLKDILFDQLNNLQSHLTEREDNSLTVVNEEKSAEGQQEDFKCKALTFKTTANTFVESVNHCFEIICRPEKLNSKSLNDSKNGSSEPTTDMYCNMLPIDSSTAAAEGIMVEEKDDAEQMINNNFVNMEINKNDDNIWQPSCQLRSHHLWPEIDQVTNEQVQYARMGLGKDAWQLFAEEGEMKMYKREEEQNGLAVDPLKACHFVRGFTAQEICHFFFRPEYRYEWESMTYR